MAEPTTVESAGARHSRVTELLLTTERSLAFAVLALALSVLVVGWWGGVDLFRRVHPSLVSMKATTAAAMALLAVGVLTARRTGRARWLSTASTTLAAAAGGWTLLEYAGVAGTGLDSLLAADPGDSHTSAPGRMGPTTAIVFVLMGAGLLGLLWCRGDRLRRASQLLAVTGGGFAFVGVASYLFGVESSRTIAHATEMALHTAIGLSLLTISIGLLSADVGPPSVLRSTLAGGVVARRTILPTVAALTLVAVLVNVTDALDSPELKMVGQLAGSTILVVMLLLRVCLAVDEEAMRAGAAQRREAALELSNARLGDFARTAAHDLRNPLAVVRGMLDLAVQPGVEPGLRDELLGRARGSVDEMTNFISGLLESVRNADASMEPVDIGEVLAELEAELADSFARAQAILGSRGALPIVHGSHAGVQHVLRNLLRNSLEHRDRRRTLVTQVSAEPLADGWWDLTVTDDGPGIPAEDRERVLGTGERGDSEAPGFGLGLAAAAQAVAAMGGQLWISDPPDGPPGTTVHVVLRDVAAPDSPGGLDRDGVARDSITG